MRQRFLVIGLGRFGSTLATSLTEAGCDVVAVDRTMTAVEAIKDAVGYAVQLDATDPEALRAVDCAACAAAVVAIGEDFEASVLTVAALRDAGVSQIIARARTSTHARILVAAGASRVLELETEFGRRLAQSLAAAEDRSTPRAAVKR